MTSSNIDKRIKNARLAVERARTGQRSPEYLAKVERELERALAKKTEMKVTRR